MGHPPHPLEEKPVHLRHVLQGQEDHEGALRLALPHEDRRSAADLEVAQAGIRDPLLHASHFAVLYQLWDGLCLPRADAAARRRRDACGDDRLCQLRVRRRPERCPASPPPPTTRPNTRASRCLWRIDVLPAGGPIWWCDKRPNFSNPHEHREDSRPTKRQKAEEGGGAESAAPEKSEEQPEPKLDDAVLARLAALKGEGAMD